LSRSLTSFSPNFFLFLALIIIGCSAAATLGCVDRYKARRVKKVADIELGLQADTADDMTLCGTLAASVRGVRY